VLNLLRGINPRFATTADIIANMSLLDFKSATNMLRVKELRLGSEGKEVSSSALAASTNSSCTSPSCQSTSSSASNRGGGGKGMGGRAKVAAEATTTATTTVVGATSISGLRRSSGSSAGQPLGFLQPLGRPVDSSAVAAAVGCAISASPTAPTSASGSNCLRAAPVLCAPGVRILGSSQPDRRPQPDGDLGLQLLGHGQRSDIPHVLQQRYSSFPSPVATVLHHGRQQAINSCS